MKSDRKLRLGAFGLGRIGRVHLENLVRLWRASKIELVAVGDRYEPTLDSALNALGDEGGVNLIRSPARFVNPERMAAEFELDGVVVASRTEDHVRDSRAFTKCGIPVMVEKPFANSIAEAFEYVGELGDDGDRLVQVGFNRFYDPATQAASEWVAAGSIGDLQQTHHILQDKSPPPPAYQSSGITADMAIHMVFEAMSFRAFELPCSVQALRFMAPHYEDRAGEGANVVHVFCGWADNSLAHLWGSRINRTGYDNEFKLIGTDGRIDVGEFVGDFGEITAKLWRGAGKGSIARGGLSEQLRFQMTRPGPDHPEFYSRFAISYANELDVFLSDIRSETPFAVGVDSGWKALLVANTAEASSRSEERRFELMVNGKPITTIEDAAEFAEINGLE